MTAWELGVFISASIRTSRMYFLGAGWGPAPAPASAPTSSPAGRVGCSRGAGISWFAHSVQLKVSPT